MKSTKRRESSIFASRTKSGTPSDVEQGGGGAGGASALQSPLEDVSKPPLSKDEVAKCQAIFENLDQNKAKRVNVAELITGLRQVGQKPSVEHAEAMIAAAKKAGAEARAKAAKEEKITKAKQAEDGARAKKEAGARVAAAKKAGQALSFAQALFEVNRKNKPDDPQDRAAAETADAQGGATDATDATDADDPEVMTMGDFLAIMRKRDAVVTTTAKWTAEPSRSFSDWQVTSYTAHSANPIHMRTPPPPPL